MAELGVDYLGGDPESPGPAPCGGTLTVTEGSMRFAGEALTAGLQRHPVRVDLPAEVIRAASVGSANHMQTLTRTIVGGVLAGGVGALIGALSGRRNQVLLVACDRGDFPFYVAFAIRGDDGAALINAMQKGRHDRGEPPLPRVEDLAGSEQLDVAERQAASLARIEVVLSEQNELLRRLVSALEHPG